MSIFSELGLTSQKNRIHEEMLYNLAACYALIEREISQVLIPYDLSPVKMNALLIIKHVGGSKGLSQSDISRRLIVTAGNITRLMDRLEKEKLIERFSQEGDRRVNLIKITEKGSRLLDRTWPAYEAKAKRISGLLGPKDLESTKDLLSDLRLKMESRSRGEKHD